MRLSLKTKFTAAAFLVCLFTAIAAPAFSTLAHAEMQSVSTATLTGEQAEPNPVDVIPETVEKPATVPVAIEPAPIQQPAVIQAELPADEQGALAQFFADLLAYVKSFGGLKWSLKIAGICFLLVGTTKVSLIRPLWDKLGWAKALLAPALALIGGILSLDSLTLAGAGAYVFSGLGAILLKEMLEAVKQIPGISKLWISVADLLKKIIPDSVQAKAK